MDDRRHEDARLARIEQSVMELHSKVNNGLTERGIRTEEMVTELHQVQTTLKETLSAHLIREENEHTMVTQEITSIKDGLMQMAKDHKVFTKGLVTARNRIFYTLLFGMCSFITWIVINSKTIGAFIEHIKKLPL